MDETARGSGQIGVFLLDDHEIVRKGVRDLLEAEPDIVVVGEAGTAESALARIPALRPNVAVLDVRLPDGDGVSVCREIRSKMPEVACLMLTSFGDDEALFDAIMAGAAGYVLKQIRGTGSLVLSEFTGAAAELRQAVPCNPFDVEGLSFRIEQALGLPRNTRRAALAAMARRVHSHDVHRWVAQQLEDIESLAHPREHILEAAGA